MPEAETPRGAEHGLEEAWDALISSLQCNAAHPDAVDVDAARALALVVRREAESAVLRGFHGNDRWTDWSNRDLLALQKRIEALGR